MGDLGIYLISVTQGATRMATWGGIGAAFGYTFALLTSRDTFAAAKVFAIGAAVNALFHACVEYTYSEKESGDKAERNRAYILWHSLAGVVALNQLHALGYITKEIGYALGAALAVVNIFAAYKHYGDKEYIYVDGPKIRSDRENWH